MAAQLVSVYSWAEHLFGERCPHRNTLLKWIHLGKIRPMPLKVGREYFCKPDAEYVDPVADKVNRMVNGR